ncbi:MAG: hypothetical protein KC457_26180, partial [Myxococcales bacterium]|nr:hypothetical protein [Myxococcales bacterium]
MTDRQRHIPKLIPLALWALLPACGDDQRGNQDDEIDGGTSLSTSDSDSGSETAEGSSTTVTTLGTDIDTTTGCDNPCGDECCGDGEVCNQDTQTCELDCGDDEPCGDPAMCCGAGELCYAGGCIVPGDPCQVGVCATDTETGCKENEVCDGELGLCVPDIANSNCTYQPEAGVFDPVPRFTWGVRK